MASQVEGRPHAKPKTANQSLSPLVGNGGTSVTLRIVDEPHALTCELDRINWWGGLLLITVASVVMIYVLATEWKQIPLVIKLGIYLLDAVLWLALYSHLFRTNRILFSRLDSSLQVRRRLGNRLVREISFGLITSVKVEQVDYDDDGSNIDNFVVDLTLRSGEIIRLTQSSSRSQSDELAGKIAQLIGR